MENSRDKKIGRATIILLVIVALSLIPWSFAAFVSLFAFDAPGSQNELPVWLMVAPLWAYPVIAASCMIVSIILYKKNKPMPALIVIAIPLVFAVISAIFLGVYVGLQPR